jgi:hypothetical protein
MSVIPTISFIPKRLRDWDAMVRYIIAGHIPVYLAQAYTYSPGQAIDDARKWTYELLKMGIITIFSPINHTHNFHVDYYKTCECCQGAICKTGMPKDCCHPDLFNPEIQIDYVQWDLNLFETVPKMVMLFAPTCFLPLNIMDDTGEPYNWRSTGAKKEYGWGLDKGHYLLDLAAFLNREIKPL